MNAHSEQGRAGRGDHLFLYDGVCGLCNRVNRFVLRHDRPARFDFASLQSPTGRSFLRMFGKNPDTLNTFYVIANYRSASPVPLSKSLAALFVVKTLGWPWRALTFVRVLPDSVLDFFYDVLGRHRYRIFGRHDVCPLPAPQHRQRFIDV